MKEKKYLKTEILLCGESNGTRFPRTFKILKKLNDGASVVCYEARHEHSGNGILKEYYPEDNYGLRRNADGQLICDPEFPDARERFRKSEKEYVEAYKQLLEAKQDSTGKDLSTFIPAFEIYNGCDNDCNIIGTTYIWTPDPELETFDTICDDIHKHPAIEPERKMVVALHAVRNLTKCISALHEAGFYNRDVCPANFGFIKRGGETLTETVSLFDINNICSAYDVSLESVGHPGFIEPESKTLPAKNVTDIYSIGATLFNAIIITDEVKKLDYLYDESFYDRLNELVDNSKLVQASEANSHPGLRSFLTKILQKTLCNRDDRYEDCETLLADLDKALYYALPSEIAKKFISGQKWTLVDAEKSLDIHQEKNSYLALQYLLYKKEPLYRYISENQNDINVLLIGFGNYGRKFLDICLQSGQIPGKTLNVTVVSDSSVDKNQYLSERPALDKFFDVDDSLAGGSGSYGNLRFEVMELSRNDKQKNFRIIQDIMSDRPDHNQPQYVFIALGEDPLNRSAALSCREAADVLGIQCVVSFAFEGETAEYKQPKVLLTPVFVNEDTTKVPEYAEVERMAFNVHLIWEKNLNIDYRKVRADFRKTYNHDSCVSNVLSLKYKLHSIGIDLEQMDFDQAAKQFYVKGYSGGNKNNAVKNELICIEHRRWVTEKICGGWTCLEDLNECAGGVTKDERRKKHVCIVRSEPDQKLSPIKEKDWDTISKSDLADMDELDRMSVELHRMYVQKARQIRKENLLSGHSLEVVRKLSEGHRATKSAFLEWESCLKDIWYGDSGKVRLYKSLKNTLIKTADVFSKEKKKAIVDQIKAFETMFYPIFASSEYRNYKQDDVQLIDNIPFILTYSESTVMVVPFEYDEDNTSLFRDTAAATVVNPSRILYLCYVNNAGSLKNIKNCLPYISQYMKKKYFRSAVEFIITYTPPAAQLFETDQLEEFSRLTDGRVQRVKLLEVEKRSEIAQKLSEYLETRSSGKRIFAIENNDSNLSGMLEGGHVYERFSSYSFDMSSRKFFDVNGCEAFTYIQKDPYITVTDMMSSRMASPDSISQPEFYNDYNELWQKYKSSPVAWKLLYNTLGDYTVKHDVLVQFPKISYRDVKPTAEEYPYIIPFTCRHSFEKILAFLKEKGIVEQESRIRNYTTDSCEVIIRDKKDNRKQFDKLFSNPYKLLRSEDVSIHSDSRGIEASITFDDLIVDGVDITGGKSAEERELLTYFNKKGFITNLIPSGDKVSFTFATKQIKNLLTSAGRILEVYAYHKAKETGQFDDVVSSYELEWEDPSVTNEFDCILTKGFTTLFVECKARPEISQEYYYKLSGLADKFGINANAVLIADTMEKNGSDIAEANAVQRKRGNEMGVVTVWEPGEISNIGMTLLSIINGKYKSK